MSVWTSVIVTAFLCASAQAAPRQKGNPYFHTCRYRARFWDDCVQNVGQELRSLFVEGIPELGVRPIDPLFVDIFNFSEVSGKFRINLQMMNVSMDGLKDYVVTGVRSNLQELNLEIRLRIPRLNFRSHYHMDGRFLFLAISGGGTCQYNFTDVDNKIVVNGHLVRRVSDDALHFRVASLQWTMLPARGSSHFSSLEGETSMFSRATSRLLNEHGEEAWLPFQRAAEVAFADVFRERINRLMMNIPYRDLFPPGFLPLHLLEQPMPDNEEDEYPPIKWARPTTTTITTTTSTTTTTTTTPPTTISTQTSLFTADLLTTSQPLPNQNQADEDMKITSDDLKEIRNTAQSFVGGLTNEKEGKPEQPIEKAGEDESTGIAAFDTDFTLDDVHTDATTTVSPSPSPAAETCRECDDAVDANSPSPSLKQIYSAVDALIPGQVPDKRSEYSVAGPPQQAGVEAPCDIVRIVESMDYTETSRKAVLNEETTSSPTKQSELERFKAVNTTAPNRGTQISTTMPIQLEPLQSPTEDDTVDPVEADLEAVTEADNLILTDGEAAKGIDEDDDSSSANSDEIPGHTRFQEPSPSRDERGALLTSATSWNTSNDLDDNNTATELSAEGDDTAGGASLSMLSHAVSEVARDFIAEAAEVLTEVFKEAEPSQPVTGKSEVRDGELAMESPAPSVKLFIESGPEGSS